MHIITKEAPLGAIGYITTKALFTPTIPVYSPVSTYYYNYSAHEKGQGESGMTHVVETTGMHMHDAQNGSIIKPDYII